MGQRAPRRFHSADAFTGHHSGDDPRVRVTNLVVASEFAQPLGHVQHLHQTRPVSGQRSVDRLAAHVVVELLVGLLGSRRSHAIRGIQPAERRSPVDATVGPVLKPFPAHLFQVGDLDIAPGLDSFSEIPRILLRRVARALAPLRIHDAHLPVVKVQVILRVDEAHRVRAVLERLGTQHVPILRVRQDGIPPEGQRELREGDRVLTHLHQAGLHLGRDALGDAARKRQHRVDEAAAQHRHDLVALLQVLDDAAPRLLAHFGDQPENVPLGRIHIGTDQEIRPGQDIKVRGVVPADKGRVDQFANLARRNRRLHAEHPVCGLGGGHVVRRGTHSADPLRDARHLFHGAPLAERLKAPELGHLEVGIGYVAGLIEEQRDLAVTLQPRDGVDANAPHAGPPSRRGSPALWLAHTRQPVPPSPLTCWSADDARLKRYRVPTGSAIVDNTRSISALDWPSMPATMALSSAAP